MQNVTTCDQLLPNITKCGNMCTLKTIYYKMWGLWAFCENPVCPDPILKPVNSHVEKIVVAALAEFEKRIV